jgi:hypothetical protein
MAKNDFYPTTFDGVDDVVGKLVTYVTGKVTVASGGTAEWTHIPAEEIQKLTELFDDYHSKHTVCKGDPIAADRLARKEAGDTLEEFTRYFLSTSGWRRVRVNLWTLFLIPNCQDMVDPPLLQLGYNICPSCSMVL